MYNPIIYLIFMGRLNEKFGSLIRNISRNGSKRSETSVKTNEEDMVAEFSNKEKLLQDTQKTDKV